MSADTDPRDVIAGGNFALWLDVLGGPIAWLLQLTTSYALVPWACTSGHHLPMHLSAIVFTLLAGVNAFAASRHRARFHPAPGDKNTARCRFMATLGVLTSSLFTLLIAVQGAATFIIGPCQN